MTNEKAIRLIRNLPTMCKFTDAYGEPIDSDDYYNAVNVAISALEKQIPMKPKMPLDEYWVCPMCGMKVEHPYYEHCTHCTSCGQVMDWSEWFR